MGLLLVFRGQGEVRGAAKGCNIRSRRIMTGRACKFGQTLVICLLKNLGTPVFYYCTHLAITLIKHRLQDAFGDQVAYEVIGEPVSLPDAKTLAEQDLYQFQWWALGLVGARPVEQKKGLDHGIDGRLYFHDEPLGGKTRQIILSVKGGQTGVAHVRDLRGVLEREKAEIGVLITLQRPTREMKREATSAGFYDSPGWRNRYPRIQILTVEELLAGKGIHYPPRTSTTFKKAPKARGKTPEELGILGL